MCVQKPTYEWGRRDHDVYSIFVFGMVNDVLCP